MIHRDMADVLRQAARMYPVVTLTGPRQSGKTTLCRAVFSDRPCVSLEAMDTRGFAREDPRGFLAQFPEGAIIDEVQRVPDLLGYIQERVDAAPAPGRFILSGSQNFTLLAAVAQSLAGRTAILHLLPPSWAELQRFDNVPDSLHAALWVGAYPRIHDRGIPAARWVADYLATYVQKDVRMLLNVSNLDAFMTFIQLCAAHSGQELNLLRLGADAGISQPTAKAWLSVLETSFICFRVPAWHANMRKRLVKTPKLFFWDTGLLCHLLGIQVQQQLHTHPLRGAIFETWVAADLLKQRHHRGTPPRASHYREVSGLEVDLVLQDGLHGTLVESKSGQTMSSSFLQPLVIATERLRSNHPECTWNAALVYGGDSRQQRQGIDVVPWDQIEALASMAPGKHAPGWDV